MDRASPQLHPLGVHSMAVMPSSVSAEIRKELRERWMRGDRVLVESYLAEHPFLQQDSRVVLDLVLSEFWLRHERGESPSFAEYSDRFPSLRDQLAEMLSDDDLERTSELPSHLKTVATSTRSLACPFCACEVETPKLTADSVNCPRCTRRFRILDETQPLTGYAGQQLGQYELLRRIGGGEFGTVWLARDTKLRREVALKLPRRDVESDREEELFLREARAAAGLRHPNIVPVYDAGRVDGVVYLAAAYIRGPSLREVMGERRFTSREAAELCRTLAEALQHAHEAGIIHRDLKPSNILLDSEGVPHIADFGLAKHAALDEITITVQGHILGTAAYMPPEQARGQSHLSGPASDVYSLGVLLYELLVGSRPFEGPLELVLHKILSEPPKPLREHDAAIPRDLETIVLKCLAKAPADRYPSAQSLADDLGRFLIGEPILARPPSLARRAWRTVRHRKTSLAIAGTALVALLAIPLWRNAAISKPEDPAAPVVQGAISVGHQEPASIEHTKQVEIVTDPAGANVVCYPLEWETGRPVYEGKVQIAGTTPVRAELPSGMYLVVAYTAEAFHEVLRSVPRDPGRLITAYRQERWEWNSEESLVEWPTIKLFPNELANEDLVLIERCDEFTFDVASKLKDEPTRWRLPAFRIAPREVTIGEFRQFGGETWIHGTKRVDLPADRLSWNIAMDYAERRGLRLPDVIESEYLATDGGTKRFPWGNRLPPDEYWAFDQPVGSVVEDRTATAPPVYGLCSGALEWTMTRHMSGPAGDGGPGLRYIVRGGPLRLIGEQLVLDQLGFRGPVSQHIYRPGLGLRCARSPEPRLQEEDFITPLP